MEEREYYFVRLPNDNVIHALDVCIGLNDTQRYNLAEDVIYVKTTPELIDSKINGGVGRSTLFPPGLTTQVTYEQALSRLRSAEFTPVID